MLSTILQIKAIIVDIAEYCFIIALFIDLEIISALIYKQIKYIIKNISSVIKASVNINNF